MEITIINRSNKTRSLLLDKHDRCHSDCHYRVVNRMPGVIDRDVLLAGRNPEMMTSPGVDQSSEVKVERYFWGI